MQIRGPAEKGTKAYGWILLMLSARNRSGLNLLTSGPQNRGFRWMSMIRMEMLAPLGSVYLSTIRKRNEKFSSFCKHFFHFTVELYIVSQFPSNHRSDREKSQSFLDNQIKIFKLCQLLVVDFLFSVVEDWVELFDDFVLNVLMHSKHQQNGRHRKCSRSISLKIMKILKLFHFKGKTYREDHGADFILNLLAG